MTRRPTQGLEPSTTSPRSDRSLNLEFIEGIRVGDSVVTPQMMQADAEVWGNRTFAVGVGEDNFGLTDEELLRNFCFEKLPLKITGEPTQPITLQAEIARFPYSINGERAYQVFGLRLIPESGRINKVELNGPGPLSMAVNGMSMTPEGVIMDLGNGSIHVEIYYEPQSDLPALTSAQGFTEAVLHHGVGS